MNNKCPFPGAHLEKILTDFLNEGRRRKHYLRGSGGQASQEMFWCLTL